jgi:hypothetical protein
MLWIDYDFDYGDQLARIYMKYQGVYYDKGTIVRLRGPNGPVDATFMGWQQGDRGNFEPIDGRSYRMYNSYGLQGANKYVLEILHPVYPNLRSIEERCSGFGMPERDKPPSWDVEVAWIWYIVIMAVAIIFKDRLMIWTFVSAVFFLWKNGFLNKKK